MEILGPILRGLFGVACIVGVATLFSATRNKIKWRIIAIGLGLQLVLGLLLTQVPFIANVFQYVGKFFIEVTQFTKEGTSFVFSEATLNPGNPAIGFVFALQVLPIIIFFSALSSALYYLGVLQWIVKGFAWVMVRTMGLSGAESISAAGNVFLGQTEAPLLVKPYIAGMTRSELMCLMTGGMATIAGSVLAAFVGMLGGDDPVQQAEFAQHLLTASIMNAPGAIVISKLLIPETNPEAINTDLAVSSEKIGANLIDAIANGTSEGLKLAMNVGAMLITFIALIAMINAGLEWVGMISLGGESINAMIKSHSLGAFDSLSLQYMLGQVFRIFAFIIGVEWSDSLVVGSLLGTKTIINEFVAYSGLSALEEGVISQRSTYITTYALCGFANFSSIAIQIAGIGGLAPNKRTSISELGLLAVLGGTLATFLTASIAGMWIQ